MRILQYIFCIFLFVGTLFAETININWIDGSTTYAQTTCDIGGDIILPATPTKRGYTFKGWVAEYTLLEYIESTGEQYIDTGYILSDNFDITIDAQVTKISGNKNYPTIMGANGGTAGGFHVVLGIDNDNNAGNTWYFYTQTTFGISYTYGGSIVVVRHSDTLRHNFHIYHDDTNHAVFDIDESHSTKDYKFPDGGNNSQYIFARNTGSEATSFTSIKCYSVKWKQNNVFVRDFIPVRRNSDGAIGMYDKVGNKFYGNYGTGEFIAGPVVDKL